MARKKTQKEVESYFADQGCVLLDNYINCFTGMRYLCVCGEQSSDCLNNFRRCDFHCEKCRQEAKIISTEVIKDRVEQKGFVFISTNYIDGKHIVSFWCNCGEKRNVDLRSFAKSSGECKKCSVEKSIGDRKPSIEEVKNYFADQGCVLLEDVYVNCSTAMRYRCVCGNESIINYDRFKGGGRCGCLRSISKLKAMDVKLKEEMATLGCTFIRRENIGSKILVTFVCRCGMTLSSSLISVRSENIFKKCKTNHLVEDLAYVKRYFLDYGCELIENVYVNAYTKMNYVCRCGKESTVCFFDFKNGRRCGCSRNRPGRERLIYEPQSRQMIEEAGYVFISYQWVDGNHLIKCLCQGCKEEKVGDLHHLLESTNGCRRCNGRSRAHTVEYVKNYFDERGCKLLDNHYENAHQKIRYICNCGREAETIFLNFQKGHRCNQCRIELMSEKFSGSGHPQWRSDREQVKIDLTFTRKCHNMVKRVLNYTGDLKMNRSAILLGYDRTVLRNHIESHQNWENVKNGVWHIDHIFPIRAFIDYGITDIKIINGLENLQPLSKTSNLSKGDRYDKEQFENWLKSKKFI